MKHRFSFPAVAVCLAAFFAIPAMANFDGAIQTTISDGSVVNKNLYATKQEAYLTGGPQNQTSNRLPDGYYYFQVTDPSGKVLLSTDAPTCRQVQVIGGVVAHSFDGSNYDGAGTTYNPQDPNNWVLTSGTACSHLKGTGNTSNGELPVALMPYSDTPNNGGVYKAWLISQDGSIGCAPANYPTPYDPFTAPSDCSKTDNYRVNVSGTCTTDCTTPQSLISGLKFYDKGFNGSFISNIYTPPSAPNGTFDAGEAVLPNWTISFTGLNQGVTFTDTLTTDGGGAWADLSDVGSTITVCEVLQSGWSQSSPTVPTDIGGITAQAIGTGTQGPTCWSGTVPASDVSNLNFGNYEAVSGTKYYDLDISHTPTVGDTPIAGFKITFCDTFSGNVCSPTSGVAFTDASGNYTFYLQSAGERVQLGEVLPSGNGWTQTGPLNNAIPIPTNTGNGTVLGTVSMNWLSTSPGGGSANGLYFTNVCEGTDFPYTLGFWGSSPVGKSALSAAFSGWASGLNTQFSGNAAGYLALIGIATKTNPATAIPAFSTTSSNAAYSELSGFLMGATGTNAANMLSAQAATMALNTLVPVNGKTVSSNDLMLVGTTAQLNAAGCGSLSVPEIVPTNGAYTSISSVLNYVEALLKAYPNTTASGNARSCEAFIQTALNNANNNLALTIIKPSACTIASLY